MGFRTKIRADGNDIYIDAKCQAGAVCNVFYQADMKSPKQKIYSCVAPFATQGRFTFNHDVAEKQTGIYTLETRVE